MKLRQKTFAIASAIVISMFLVLFLVLGTLLLRTFRLAEKEEVSSEAKQALKAIEETAKEFSERFADWSSWDDAQQFILDKNATFIETNLNDESVYGALKLNLMIFTDAAGQIVYQAQYDPQGHKKDVDESLLKEHFSGSALLRPRAGDGKNFYGILNFSEGPLLVSYRPILNSKGEGSSSGTLITGRRLDEAQIRRLSNFTELDFSVYSTHGDAQKSLPADITWALKNFSDRTKVIPQFLSQEQIAAYTQIPDIYGDFGLVLKITRYPQMYVQGRNSLYSFLLSLVCIGVFFVVVSVFVQDRIILKPLLRLNRDVQKIQMGNKISDRVHVSGSDEISSLALSINGMLTSIEGAHNQLLQSQKMDMIGTLAGGIAHDLNNQLTPVLGYVDLVRSQLDPKSVLADNLLQAQKSAEHCVQMIERLKNISRPGSSEKKFIKINTVIEELKPLLHDVIPSTIKVEIECEKGLWPVLANTSELHSVIMNLATNARDALINRSGQMAIKAYNTQKEKPYVCLQVEDNGCGISPADLPHIFEPFYTKKTKGGTGLGLAMVFRVVKNYGGEVEVQSQEGKGTVFRLYFPANPKAILTPEYILDESIAMPHGNHETILFADDEEALRHVGRSFLERLGYKVLLARDGEEALQIYHQKENEISAVILDMTMPKMSGKEALKKILEMNSKAKVITASGYTSEGNAKDLIQAGAKDYLAKPFTILPFAQKLRHVLDH